MPTQYTDTMEQLGRYASHTYKYGENIHLMVQTLEHTPILKPESLKEEKSDVTDKKIWENQVDKYVKRLNIYQSNLKNLYSVVWDQCFLSIQAKKGSQASYKAFNHQSDCIELLREIRESVYQLKSKAYLHD